MSNNQKLVLEDLIVPCSIPLSSLLEKWRWLIPDLSGLQLAMVTKMGDIFIAHAETGQILFLDVLDGELEMIADSVASFEQLLKDDEFVMDYFSSDLVVNVLNVEMPANTVFNFKKPPVLGGSCTTEDLVLIELQTHCDEMGQLWSELDELSLKDLEDQ